MKEEVGLPRDKLIIRGLAVMQITHNLKVKEKGKINKMRTEHILRKGPRLKILTIWRMVNNQRIQLHLCIKVLLLS